MYLQASQIIGRFILVDDLDGHAGTIDRLIIDPADGQVRALAIRPPAWLAKEQYLATIDIVGAVREGFIIRDVDQVGGLDDLVRVADILKRHLPIIGQAARTVGGQSLGKVNDLLVDIDLWVVTKYYLRGLLDERILPASQVHALTKQAVIFVDQDDRSGTIKPEAAAA